jgi:anti-sigma factor (TIGR02949 family)
MTSHSRFTCEEAFRRLDDYLDRELSPAEMELVGSHLEICAGCASEFSYERSVLRGISAKVRQIDVPQSLRDRVLAALARERARDSVSDDENGGPTS